MQRRFMIAGLLLLALAASTVRVRYVPLGWGGYWAIDFVAPWRR